MAANLACTKFCHCQGGQGSIYNNGATEEADGEEQMKNLFHKFNTNSVGRKNRKQMRSHHHSQWEDEDYSYKEVGQKANQEGW